MPGGVDIHCHIAGSKVNAARQLRPEDHRDDVLAAHAGSALGDRRQRADHLRHRLPVRRARLHDGRRRGDPAARRPSRARELRDTPIIDKAFLVLMGNNQLLFDQIRESRGAGRATARRGRLVA